MAHVRGGGECPELRRPGKEAEELGHHVRREAVHVVDLVQAVVHHQSARAQAHARDAEVGSHIRRRLELSGAFVVGVG